MPHFGPRIIGEEEFARQSAQERRTGGNVFGPRVTGEIPTRTPEAAELNPHARQSAANTLATKDQAQGSVAVAEIERLLTENPTHLDTLYELECVRADGPRPEALHVFKAFELRGASRASVIAEIDALLTETAPPPKVGASKPKAKAKK